MIRMTVAEMLDATGATLVLGDALTTFEGVGIDSRLVPEGGMFVAFAGERVDGNRFAAAALTGRSRVVVLTAEADEATLEAARTTGGVVVRAAHDDGEQFMLDLATRWRQNNPQWLVVGVTGSVGKTTTKDMLAAGIGVCRKTHATAGNHNNLLGVPLTLFAASADDEVLVVEMGMNHAGELRRIAAAARPHVAVITNIGTSHVGNLGSREAIAAAKAEVVSGMCRDGAVPPWVVLTEQDDYSAFIERQFCAPAGVGVMRVGGQHSQVWAHDVALDDEGLPSFVLAFGDGCELRAKLPLPGAAMVADVVSAMGVAEALGLAREKVLGGICAMRPTRMRLEVCQKGSSARVIDDSYNASPSSMAAALDVLCAMRCEGRRVAVLGEMGELGDQSARLHAMAGAYAAAKPLDLLVLVGDEGAHAMAEAARTMGFSEDRMELFGTAADAARVMVPVLAADDLVLVKASRAVGLDLFAKEVLGR